MVVTHYLASLLVLRYRSLFGDDIVKDLAHNKFDVTQSVFKWCT